MQKSLWNQTQFQNKSQIFSFSADAHFPFNNKFVFLRFRTAEIYFTIHQSSILNPIPISPKSHSKPTENSNLKMQLNTANCKLNTANCKLRLKTENYELKTKKKSLHYFTKKSPYLPNTDFSLSKFPSPE